MVSVAQLELSSTQITRAAVWQSKLESGSVGESVKVCRLLHRSGVDFVLPKEDHSGTMIIMHPPQGIEIYAAMEENQSRYLYSHS